MPTIFNTQHARLLWRAWQAEVLSAARVVLEVAAWQAEQNRERTAWPSIGSTRRRARRSDRKEWADCLLIILSGLFDYEFYVASNPDVPKPILDAVKHYLIHGGLEERAPSPEFDGARYLSAYPDIRAAAANPLVHFIRYGAAEGRLDAVQIHQPPLAGARRGARSGADLVGTATKLAAALQEAGVKTDPDTPLVELRHVAQAAWATIQADLEQFVLELERTQINFYAKNAAHQRSITHNDKIMIELSLLSGALDAERQRASSMEREADQLRGRSEMLAIDLEDANREIIYWRKRATDPR
ncbi:hypothetical protein [Methylobacterium sp. J-077]|uniref:hypothetical protein n=1 Tax=Methylobacterium sp. J-077 TaxID=2836656 RepID=UPI001FBAF69C|nr:hypothetical protein [Methylobacterium sp. J-077]MCJ2126395.1 hypothetical protein [Methylobacterium sp. J-077]